MVHIRREDTVFGIIRLLSDVGTCDRHTQRVSIREILQQKYNMKYHVIKIYSRKLRMSHFKSQLKVVYYLNVKYCH